MIYGTPLIQWRQQYLWSKQFVSDATQSFFLSFFSCCVRDCVRLMYTTLRIDLSPILTMHIIGFNWLVKLIQFFFLLYSSTFVSQLVKGWWRTLLTESSIIPAILSTVLSPDSYLMHSMIDQLILFFHFFPFPFLFLFCFDDWSS